MKVFVGVGLGPIQTGIFMSGACRGGFDRIVIAEVDDKLRNAINSNGGVVTINTAYANCIKPEVIKNVEVYNPNEPEGRAKLVEAAAEACELATALPSVKFFAYCAPWMVEGFRKQPERTRFIYTAENNNRAAEELEEALGEKFPNTYCLNTVVGKMSGVVPEADCAARGVEKLAPAADRAHLVEAFNKIYISSCPGIENRCVENLYVKNDLLPFEEAKLYGHNAIHFLLGTLGKTADCEYMSDLTKHPELIALAREAFINESGAALCKKYAGFDELFTAEGFKAYAEDLLERMPNPFLQDAIARITRDLPRKLSWEDRVVGTMRLVLSQNETPRVFAKGAALAAKEEFGSDPAAVKAGLQELWGKWDDEAQKVWALIEKNL